MNPFQSLHEYEEFIYTLIQRYPSVQRSTLIVVKRGKRTAVVQGEIAFPKGLRIFISERLSFDNEQVVIENYGYEYWKNDKKSYGTIASHIQTIRLWQAHIRITNMFNLILNIIVSLRRICVLINQIFQLLSKK